jgi:hypothetical protein
MKDPGIPQEFYDKSRAAASSDGVILYLNETWKLISNNPKADVWERFKMNF